MGTEFTECFFPGDKSISLSLHEPPMSAVSEVQTHKFYNICH